MSAPGYRLGLLRALLALQAVWLEVREGQDDLPTVPDQRGWGLWVRSPGRPLPVRRRQVDCVGRVCRGPWGARWLFRPQACQVRQGAGAVLGQQGVGRLTIGVHVVTWHLGRREALLEGVAAAIGALLHGHDLLLRRGQRRVGGHHALHATRQDLWGQSTPSLTGPACPVLETSQMYPRSPMTSLTTPQSRLPTAVSLTSSFPALPLLRLPVAF